LTKLSGFKVDEDLLAPAYSLPCPRTNGYLKKPTTKEISFDKRPVRILETNPKMMVVLLLLIIPK
jgi:hypothetical protein